MRTNIFVLLIPIAIFAGFIWLGVQGLTQDVSGKTVVSNVGKNVPDINLPLLDSPLFFTKGSITGKKVLVNFFASWCAPCEAEHEFLNTIRKSAAVPIIGVVYKDKDEAVKNYLAKHENPFALVALDRDGRGSMDFGVTGVPETFLIAADGTILAHIAGPLTQDVWDKFFKALVEK
jgi:cytochrome c biogenesis protein CcmG, thiol:disulfide interchange protein DsbE